MSDNNDNGPLGVVPEACFESGNPCLQANCAEDDEVLPNGLTRKQNRNLDAVMARDAECAGGHLCDRKAALRTPAVADNATLAGELPVGDERQEKPIIARGQWVS